MKTATSPWLVGALVLLGCGGDPADDGGGSSADSSGAGTAEETGSASAGSTGEPTGGASGLCDQVAPPCVDAAIQDLSLQEKLSAGTVMGTREGDDWVVEVDATAGGAMDAAINAWMYLRFTDAGLEKVELDDIAALTSSDWDIAAKRYGIRVNSGSSGPSCVTVAAASDDYATLATAPADAEFAVENYYTADCTLTPDDHGLGDPNYRMAGWWGYEGCVKTTGTPFVLRLADGRALKLVIESYYAEGQAACNETNAMGSGGAQMTWRWRFLP